MASQIAAATSGARTVLAGERAILRTFLFVSVAFALALVTLNAVRPTDSTTVADFGFVLAAAGIALAMAANPSWRVPAPRWLIGAAGVILGCAFVLELFPPGRPSQAALLFPGGAYDLFPEFGFRGEGSNLGGAARLAGLFLLAVVIAAAADSERRIRVLAGLWIGGVCLSSLVGVVDYLGAGSIGADIAGVDYARYDKPRVAGLATHPNVLGLTTAMALPVAVAWLGGTRGRRRLLSIAVVLLLLAGVGLSGSRAAVVGAGIGVAVVALLNRDTRKWAVLLAAGAVVAVVVLGAVASTPLPSVDRLTGGGSAGSSSEERSTIVREVAKEIEERPVVGHGFEYIRGAHSIYLQLLHAGGAVALLAFLVFASGTLGLGIRSRNTSRLRVSLRTLASALTASMAVWLAMGFVSPAILERYLYVPAGLLLAIWTLWRRDEATTSPDIARG
jgi:O-Antigen ligase